MIFPVDAVVRAWGLNLGFFFWQPISRSVSLAQCDFLLEAEKVVVEVGQFVFSVIKNLMIVGDFFFWA